MFDCFSTFRGSPHPREGWGLEVIREAAQLRVHAVAKSSVRVYTYFHTRSWEGELLDYGPTFEFSGLRTGISRSWEPSACLLPFVEEDVAWVLLLNPR